MAGHNSVAERVNDSSNVHADTWNGPTFGILYETWKVQKEARRLQPLLNDTISRPTLVASSADAAAGSTKQSIWDDEDAIFFPDVGINPEESFSNSVWAPSPQGSPTPLFSNIVRPC